MNAYSTSSDMYAEIVRDDEYLFEAMAENDNGNNYPHASAFTIVECNIGQTIWVRGGSDSDYMYGGSTRTSHFSGALIYAYV